MADRINLVQGDTLPWITLTLTNPDTGAAVDVSDPGTTVRVYFRAAGSTTILSTLTCTKVVGSSNKVKFNFPSPTLTVPPGAYEGEVEINYGTDVQTVYDILKFRVRAQFA